MLQSCSCVSLFCVFYHTKRNTFTWLAVRGSSCSYPLFGNACLLLNLGWDYFCARCSTGRLENTEDLFSVISITTGLLGALSFITKSNCDEVFPWLISCCRERKQGSQVSESSLQPQEAGKCKGGWMGRVPCESELHIQRCTAMGLALHYYSLSTWIELHMFWTLFLLLPPMLYAVNGLWKTMQKA